MRTPGVGCQIRVWIIETALLLPRQERGIWRLTVCGVLDFGGLDCYVLHCVVGSSAHRADGEAVATRADTSSENDCLCFE